MNMVAFTLRLEEEIYEKTKESEETNKRSLNSEINFLLEKALNSEEEKKAD